MNQHPFKFHNYIDFQVIYKNKPRENYRYQTKVFVRDGINQKLSILSEKPISDEMIQSWVRRKVLERKKSYRVENKSQRL